MSRDAGILGSDNPFVGHEDSYRSSQDLGDCPPANADRLAWVKAQAVIPADEWAARYAHQYPLWSWADYDYGDAYLNAWVREVPAIFTDRERLAAARMQYLTPEERQAAERYIPL